jgi:o-succinylbenzoate---CoA ligase
MTDDQGLTLNGLWYSSQTLLDRQNVKDNNDHLVGAVLNFLKSWYDPSSDIELQTSGSTGKPRKIKAPKAAMVASAQRTAEFFGLKKGMKAHLCLSPQFVAAKMMIVRAIVLQMDLVTTKAGADALEGLDQEVDISAMVPLQVAAILKKEPQKLDLVKTLLIGGGPVTAYLEQQLKEVATDCWHTYGMTETLTHVAVRALNGSRASDWYTPLKGVRFSVNKSGCLLIDAPEISQQVIQTNDLVVLENNRIKITGRLDEVIISAGHKINPGILEEKIGRLLSIPFFVGSASHPSAGQIPVLVIEAVVSADELQVIEKKLKNQLPAFEMPREIKTISNFKYLPSGKIDRKATMASLYPDNK